MDNNYTCLLILLFVGLILFCMMSKQNEKFCSVAPKFDDYYRVHQGKYSQGERPSQGYVEDPTKDHPLYNTVGPENQLQYSTHHGCRSCGGDFCSVAPKRDRYYQINQGYLGDNILSGYPYYKAY